jgi:hypothetical protein
MKCIINDHENFEICGLCVNPDCEMLSRLVCPKCLVNYHSLHAKTILLFNDILENKKKDVEYLDIIPQINKMKEIVIESQSNKSKMKEIEKTIEIESSQIYDQIHQNFQNINLELKNDLKKYK